MFPLQQNWPMRRTHRTIPEPAPSSSTSPRRMVGIPLSRVPSYYLLACLTRFVSFSVREKRKSNYMNHVSSSVLPSETPKRNLRPIFFFYQMYNFMRKHDLKTDFSCSSFVSIFQMIITFEHRNWAHLLQWLVDHQIA